MTLHTCLLYMLGFILALALFTAQGVIGRCEGVPNYTDNHFRANRNSVDHIPASWHVHGLQCYGCNVIHGQKYVDIGCSKPEIITCTHSHKGFKHRFCIKTESMALGIVLTSGCATSRHCQQQELPGVNIYCCDTDLCNSAPCWHPGTLHYTCMLVGLIVMHL